MSDMPEIHRLQGELNVAEAIAQDYRRQINEIEVALDQYDHVMPGEELPDAVRRLLALAYNADDGRTRLPLDPADARTAALLHAVDTAWTAEHVPEGVTPSEYLWSAVRRYMET